MKELEKRQMEFSIHIVVLRDLGRSFFIRRVLILQSSFPLCPRITK